MQMHDQSDWFIKNIGYSAHKTDEHLSTYL